MPAVLPIAVPTFEIPRIAVLAMLAACPVCWPELYAEETVVVVELVVVVAVEVVVD